MDFNLNFADLSKKTKITGLDTDTIYDTLIIGGGPAALTAAVYCMRKGVTAGLITKGFGGQVAETAGIENYMGYNYIEGFELVEKFKTQIKQFELGHREGYLANSITPGKVKEVTLENGQVFKAKTLIITTGKSSRKLNVPGEKEFTGRGVAYCATCDAPLFKGKTTAVVGGGNSGVEAAIDLAKLAKKVYLFQHSEKLSADTVLVESLKSYPNVEIHFTTKVHEIFGEKKVTRIAIHNTSSNTTSTLDLDGIFVEIGLVPNTAFVKGVLELNKSGEIIVDCGCKTSIPGIYAAGDVTTVPYKQIIIAAGEGAKAALAACDFLLKH